MSFSSFFQPLFHGQSKRCVPVVPEAVSLFWAPVPQLCFVIFVFYLPSRQDAKYMEKKEEKGNDPAFDHPTTPHLRGSGSPTWSKCFVASDVFREYENLRFVCPTCFWCSRKKRMVLFSEFFETASSWQHDYNTTYARQSKLGATPTAQVSETTQRKKNIHPQSEATFPNSGCMLSETSPWFLFLKSFRLQDDLCLFTDAPPRLDVISNLFSHLERFFHVFYGNVFIPFCSVFRTFVPRPVFR